MTEPNPSAEAPASRIVIVMPTYNERQNLESIAGRVRAALPAADLLVVDDNSPDGTGDLADKLAEADPHVQVMHRTDKAGLGKAYIAGFGWALERGYDVIVEMDADGSHQPEHLPSLVGALDYADLSIGSRWVPGGRVVNWPKTREALSRAANIYTRIMLGLGVRDATAGFRAYRAATLRTISLDQVESTGYCFQIDLTLRVADAGLRIVEVPITFVEREHGASQDEQQHHRRGVLAGRAVGRDPAAPPAEARTEASGARRAWASLGLRRECSRGQPCCYALRRCGRLVSCSVLRRSLMTSRRSASTASRSSTVRRSISMSQWLRGGLTFFGDGDSPVAAIAIAPQTRHSHVGGSSASAAKGTLKWCPFGQSKATS